MRSKVLIGVVALVLAAAVGLGVWWFALAPGQRAREVAARAASSFATGIADDDAFDRPVGAELERIYAGMGDLRPKVEVTRVERDAEGVMRADLAWSWEIHVGKPAWEYATSVVLAADGGSWRAVWTPQAVYPGLTAEQSLRATRLGSERGAIRGQGGALLAWNQPAYRVGIDKTLVDQPTAEASAVGVAEVLGVDAERLLAQVRGSGPKAFVEARVLRVDNDAESALAARATQWPGVRALKTTRPLGLSSTFARPILGYVTDATAEQVEQSGGRIRAGDLAGRGGLQEVRDHVLAGTTGFVVSLVEDGKAVQELFRVDPLNGTDVTTTLDVDLQLTAELILADLKPPSALVAIRPSDGAILAAASGPGSAGYSTATLGQFAPGSTFKTVTSLAMLRGGATPKSTVTCPDGLVVDGTRFDNWQGYPASALGEVSLATAFAWSCNSAFLSQADAVSAGDLAQAASSLGLTAAPQLVVGGFLGSVPEDSSGAEHAASLIGQGRVLASPLGMATVAASVAAGHTVSPVLVLEPGFATAAPTVALTAQEAESLRTLMRGVVTDGTARVLADLPGDPVMAKTGTSTASADGVTTHQAWMIAIQGDLAVAAFVDNASSGSADAGPLVKSFLQAA